MPAPPSTRWLGIRAWARAANPTAITAAGGDALHRSGAWMDTYSYALTAGEWGG